MKQVYLCIHLIFLAFVATGLSGEPAVTTSPEVLPVNVDSGSRSLEATTGEHWFRLFLDGRNATGDVAVIPYVLTVSGVVLPPGNALHVTAFTDGVPSTPPTAEGCTASTEDIICEIITEPFREITLLTNGFDSLQIVDLRLTILGDEDAPTTYSLLVYRSTGANNGIVSNIGTITQSKDDSVVGVVTLETWDQFVAGRGDSTYQDLDAIRLYRSIAFLASGQSFNPMERVLVDEWDAANTPHPTCSVMEGTLLREIPDAVTLWDNSLPDFGGQAATVLYFVDVVIDGQEIPANMAANPTVASYIPGQTIQAPDCTTAATPITLAADPMEENLHVTMFDRSAKGVVFTLSHDGTTSIEWSAESETSWLGIDQTTGSIPAGESAPLAVSINPTNIPGAPGVYTGTIELHSPDADDPLTITVHVERGPHSDIWSIE